MAQHLGAIWIVETQYRSLNEGIRSAQRCRMLGIAFDFSRTSHMAFGDDTLAKAGKRHRRSEVERLTGYNLFRLRDVRDDLFIWGSRRGAHATAQAGQSE